MENTINWKKEIFTRALAIVAVCGFWSVAFAEETAMEKAETQVNEAVDTTKETYRDMKDKVCETVNGKVECAAKKVANKARTLKDKTETKAKEIKNKVD